MIRRAVTQKQEDKRRWLCKGVKGSQVLLGVRSSPAYTAVRSLELAQCLLVFKQWFGIYVGVGRHLTFCEVCYGKPTFTTLLCRCGDCVICLNLSLVWTGPPGPPGGLLVKNVAETSVELRWSRGYDNHSPIGKYVIMGRSPLSSEWRKMRTGVCVFNHTPEQKEYCVLTLSF